jgi:MoxR-like ATPase
VSWPKEVHLTIKRLNGVKTTLKEMFTARDRAVDLLVLATVCREHLLFIGPPGTAKTEIINQYTQLVDARGFHYLLTRFTEPSELFGPLDLEKFQQGTYTIRTDRMLPDAQIAFVDEVFQGSSAILNSLLTLLNERVFHNGAERQVVPLISMIGASNIVPDDPWLRAFADRFVLRLELQSVEDDQIDELLSQGWELEKDRVEAAVRAARGEMVGKTLRSVKIEDVLDLHARLLEVDLSRIRPEYGQLVRELKAEGVDLSDRRIVKGLKLIAGAALLREADTAAIQDLWPLVHMWGRPEEADVMRSVVVPRLAEAGDTSLDLARPVADVLMDLEVLVNQESLAMTESAIGAFLMALNKLRRELINNHSGDKDSRLKVETVIKRGLYRLEGKDV